MYTGGNEDVSFNLFEIPLFMEVSRVKSDFNFSAILIWSGLAVLYGFL